MFRRFFYILDSDPYDEEYGKYLKKYNSLNELFGIISLFLISIFVLIIFIYFLFNNRAETKFYTIDLKTNKVEQLITYDSPILSGNSIVSWSEKAAKDILSFNFLNYKEKMRNNQIYFSKNGYNTFITFFETSELLEEVLKSKLEVSLVPISTPIIVDGTINMYGKHTWTLEIPVFLNYKGANPTISQRYFLILNIEEANTDTYQSGLYITELRLFN